MPTVTMTALVAAILATLRAHAWPSPIKQIGYRQPELPPDSLDDAPTRIETPALLLHLGERRDATGEPGILDVPGRLARRVRCELHCLLSTATPNLPLELLEMAESAAALVGARESSAARRRGHRWGLLGAVEYPESIADEDADPIDTWHGHAVRVVSWDQIVYLPEVLG